MRASEFISEARKTAKQSKRANQSTRGLHKFRDPGGYDRTYELNRIMMATACADGTNTLVLDAETYSGRYNTAHPYTDLEADMLTQAYKAVGSEVHDLNKGDMRSMELDSTNKTSPVIGFKGFKK
jgi:hypothetical protein